MKRIVYFHGFNGSPNSNTKKAIEEGLRECLTVGVHINHSADPFITEYSLRRQLDILCGGADDLLFIGNSAGAFWATHFSSEYDADVLLINPSCNPTENLVKYGLEEGVLECYKIFYNKGVDPKARVHVVLGDKDEVVDNSGIDGALECVTRLPDEGHRLLNLEPVINIIRNKFMD